MNPTNYNPEIELNKQPQPIDMEQMDIIKEKMKKSICKIINDKGCGTGFFCKIPFPDEFNLLPVIITNYHVIDQNDLKQGKRIQFSLNNDQLNFNILIDNSRKTYTNKEYDVTIIEIKQIDGLNGYSLLEIDEHLYNDDDFKNIYKNKTIYLIQYPHGQKVKYSLGVIQNIYEDNYTIEHLCSTATGSSGGPIIYLTNHKVIGIHKGNKNKQNFNLGTLLKEPINNFKEMYIIHNKLELKTNNFMNNNNKINLNLNNNYMNNQQSQNFNQINQYENNNLMNMNMPVDNNQNMNFINNLYISNNKNQNINNNFNIKEEDNNNIKDIYPYIKEPKKVINFIKADNTSQIVKIPIFLRKNELYSTAEEFKCYKYSDIIQLNHKNKILNNDDSSIDLILNGDSIKIIEDNSLFLKYKNAKKINIIFCAPSGLKTKLYLPVDITVNEMIKAFLFESKIPYKYKNRIDFLYNCSLLSFSENKLLKDFIFQNNAFIDIIDIYNSLDYIYLSGKPGKTLEVNIEYNKNIFTKILVGTLVQIKNFYEDLISLLSQYMINNPIIYIKELELKKDDERTFSSIGIRDNFICKIEGN